jgi:hypothetical protein
LKPSAAPSLSRVERSALTTATFTVHVRAVNPLTGEVAYEQDRVVTTATWSRRNEVTLELEHGWGVAGGGTLGYLGAYGRNVRLDLDYTITQTEPLRTVGGGRVVLDRFRQGRLTNPEVGPVKSYLIYHEEEESLVENIKGLKQIRFWMTFSDNAAMSMRPMKPRPMMPMRTMRSPSVADGFVAYRGATSA